MMNNGFIKLDAKNMTEVSGGGVKEIVGAAINYVVHNPIITLPTPALAEFTATLPQVIFTHKR
ncbi:hypothetical protein [Ruminococcus sp.]|uniref:hypothetical protein n=1 Tax=Ruminococcus sp. TaxID=41978 RepID=UPI0025FE433A|nr:hypothetical protein [Ruminococcus sp.]